MAAAEKIQKKSPLPVRARKHLPHSLAKRSAFKWKVPAVNSGSGLLGLPAVPSTVQSPCQGMAGGAAVPSCPLPEGDNVVVVKQHMP
jgi:hypothetical protein